MPTEWRAGPGLVAPSASAHASTPLVGRRRDREEGAEGAEEDSARNKRQRTALACESCRNRKSRCDGAQPVCSACQAMGFACMYRRPVATAVAVLPQAAPAPEPSRMMQVESRLHMIEALLQQMSRAIPAARASPAAPREGTSSPIAALEPAVAEENTVDGMGAVSFAGEAVSHYFGLSSNPAFSAQISRAIKAMHSPSNVIPASTVHARASDVHSHGAPVEHARSHPRDALSPIAFSRPASPRRRHPGKTADPLSLPRGDEMLRLANAYFAHAGGYFPFVDKASVLRAVRSMDQNIVSNMRRPFLSLLNAIFACGMSLTLPNSQDVQSDEAQAALYFERASALSSWTTLNTANLETVQGLAVMVQYAESTSCSALTWKFHGQLMQAAYNIGLHIEASYTAMDITPLEREMRHRTWHMCLVLDRMLSSTLGRPPLLQEPTSQVPLPSEGEPIDNGTPSLSQVMGQSPSFRELFVETIQLFHLLGNVISELYHHNRAPRQSLSLEKLLPGVIKLDKDFHDWQSNLGPTLRLVRGEQNNLPFEGNAASGRVVLTLRYLSGLLLLYRVILSEYLANIADGLRLDQPPPIHDACKSYTRHCANIAKEIIDLIQEAKSAGAALPSWWFVLYYVFQAALAIFGTFVYSHSSMAEGNLCEFDVVAQLQKALDTVDGVAKGTGLARRCSKYLTSVIQAVQALQPLNAHVGMDNFPDFAAGAVSQEFSQGHAAFSSLYSFDLDGGLFFGDGNFEFLNNISSAAELTEV